MGKKLQIEISRKRVAPVAEPSDEKLMQFQSISGLPFEDSLQFLLEAKWDLEVTCYLYFIFLYFCSLLYHCFSHLVNLWNIY